jgi:hypothetical protein
MIAVFDSTRDQLDGEAKAAGVTRFVLVASFSLAVRSMVSRRVAAQRSPGGFSSGLSTISRDRMPARNDWKTRDALLCLGDPAAMAPQRWWPAQLQRPPAVIRLLIRSSR